MGSPTRTVHFEKVWSPASRDPRFSRRTPDRLLARADANRSVTTIGEPTSSALGILTSKVRRTVTYDPKRAKYIAQLTKVVERVEKERVDSAREVVTDSPAPRAMQTAIFQQPLRGDCAHPHAPYGVGSPANPFKATFECTTVCKNKKYVSLARGSCPREKSDET